MGLGKIGTLYDKDGFTSDGLKRQVISKVVAISSIESYSVDNWKYITI